MSTIVTRAGKGSPLTHTEVDNNFTNLNTDKYQSGNNASFGTLAATGVATFSAGTVSAPALTTTGDTNTGIFFPAADTIAFTEGGVESMRIDSSGNVGIGTSTATDGGVTITTNQTRDGSVNAKLALQSTGSNNYPFLLFSGCSSTTRYGGIIQTTSTSGNTAASNAASIQFPMDSATACHMSFWTNANIGTSNLAERMRITSAGAVLIGTTSTATSSTLNIDSAGYQPLYVNTTISGGGGAAFSRSGTQALYTGTAGSSWLTGSSTADGLIRSEANMLFATGNTERMRIQSNGNVLIGKTASSGATLGIELTPSASDNYIFVTNNASSACLYLNREGSDGTLVIFRQASTDEGSISVSGTTVSYNGGHLSRWAQTTSPKDDTLLKGTVLSNLDEMNEYVDAEGNVVANEQLNKVKVSDVEGDVNVAGVFVNWSHDEQHNVDEINMAMTGDMIIRIAEGVVVQKGDLLMSAGDGTAKPQGDDIVRSKTIAKVTSNHITCTYADGSYCVPCVLMAC